MVVDVSDKALISKAKCGMMRVGIVLGDTTRRIFVETISKFFEVFVCELPNDLPDVIDEEFEFPEELFEADIILSYAFHPDVNIELIKKAEERGVKYVLVAGGFKFLKRFAKNVRVIVDDVCCSTFVKGIEFFERFGIPEFEITLSDDGKIKDVRVVRSALCGATFFVAEKLKGLSVEEAPRMAGYFTQIYPCLASRGIKGGIHKAANLHKLAVERAIKRAIQKG